MHSSESHGVKPAFFRMNQQGTITMAIATTMMMGMIASMVMTMCLTISGSGWLCKRSAKACIENTPEVEWKL